MIMNKYESLAAVHTHTHTHTHKYFNKNNKKHIHN